MACVILGALATVWLVDSLMDRVGVVAVGREVRFGEIVQNQDLVEVQLPADAALRPVRWGDVATVIGKRATTDLRVGSLVTADSVRSQDVPPPGRALVGIPAKINQLPATPLHARDRVLLVPFIPNGGGGSTAAGGDPDSGVGATARAEVFAVRAPDASGLLVIDVLIVDSLAADLARRAATGQVAIVLVAT